MNSIDTIKKGAFKILDLFNSTKLTAAVEKKHKQRQLELVAMAHHEFNTAQEKLLADAEKIINNRDIVVWEDRLEVLKKMKFTQSEEFKILTKKIQDYEDGRTAKNIYHYFTFWYPNYKVIHRNQIESICEKYGLVIGETSLYKGSIPEKNINEMSRFKMKQEDYPIFQRVKEKIVQEQMSFYRYVWKEVHSAVKRNEKVQNEFHPDSTELCIYEFDILTGESEKRYSRSPRFFICAPVKDMDTENKPLVGPYIIDDDPIVLLQIAQDLFLIITAWGPEASDPAVVNQRFN